MSNRFPVISGAFMLDVIGLALSLALTISFYIFSAGG